MSGLNRLERWLFDLLTPWSDVALAAFPVAVFLVVAVLGIAVEALIAHRLPPTDPYVTWLVVIVAMAAFALYWAAFMALAVVFLRSRRFRLLELHQSMRDIQAMSWREFEDLVAANYSVRGYRVEPLGGDFPDGGIDLILRKDGETRLVQCKHYRDQWVGERPLREFLGVVSSRRASGGIFVACGVFDEKALAFAKKNPQLELIGGEQLRELVQQTVHQKAGEARCPKCGSSMRDAVGRFGAFLGCVNFPACRGWLPIREGSGESAPTGA